MTIVGDFQNGVSEALGFGQQVRFRYFNVGAAGSGYDDDISLSISGTDYWVSGVILPITGAKGSSDAVLLEQGKILSNDTKLYIEGAVNTSGTLKIGLGSRTNMSGCEYSLMAEGVTKWNVNEVPVLKKLFIRRLTTGSLMGE